MKQRTYPRWKIRKFKRLPGVVYRSLAPEGTPLWEIVYIRSPLHESNPYVSLRRPSYNEVRELYVKEADEEKNAATRA